MRRFFVEHISPNAPCATITGKEAKHIRNVLRLKKGERLEIMDGSGWVAKAVIEEVSSDEVKVNIHENIFPPPPKIEISLAQALIKGPSMDYVIQKATELGVNSIQPFYSKRTVVKLQPEHLIKKLDRWRKLIMSACKQCGRPVLPQLYKPLTFNNLVKKKRDSNSLKLLLWEKETASQLKELLINYSSSSPILILVGPEGGFTKEETKIATESGFYPIALGNRILRAETASIALLSIIQYELGDLGREL